MQTRVEGVKVSWNRGYLNFSEEVEGEVGIYYAGKRLRDYTMIRKHPMLALYTIYVGDQARYLNYFKSEGKFKGSSIELSPLYGGYMLDESEEGIVFFRCVKIGDSFVVPITNLQLLVEAENDGCSSVNYGEEVSVSGEYTVKVRRCILDAGVDVTEEIGKNDVEWKPVIAEKGLISFKKDVVGIPEEIKRCTIKRGKIRILSDATFALSETYLILKRGFRTKYKIKLNIFPKIKNRIEAKSIVN